MPHLSFEVSEPLEENDVEPFAEWVTELYAEVMNTGTGHVAVTVRDDAALAMGRAEAGEPVAVLDADVRAGRPFEKRRELASAVIEEMEDRLGVPAENTYVVYTEHAGEDFILAEGPLASWSVEEDDEGPPGIE